MEPVPAPWFVDRSAPLPAVKEDPRPHLTDVGLDEFFQPQVGALSLVDFERA